MLFTLIFTLLSCDFKKPDSASSDREALLNAHERILEAHRKRGVAYNHNINTDRYRQESVLPLLGSNILLLKYTHTLSS